MPISISETVKDLSPILVLPDSPEFEQVCQARNDRLNRPHDEPDQLAPTSADFAALTLGLLNSEGMVAASSRLAGLGGKVVRLERVCVAGRYELGRGIGSVLVRSSHEIARESGAHQMRLMARDGTQGFYAKLGYVETGEWGAKGPFMITDL